MAKEVVVILGASDKPDRYSYKAFKLLEEFGHSVILVRPGLKDVDGHSCLDKISDIKEKVDTLTLYVNPKRSTSVMDQILSLNPKRVIFNPGTENSELLSKLQENKIETVIGCTLVMLKTSQF